MRDIWMYGVIHRICNMKAKRKKQLFSISRYLTTMVPGSSALKFQAGQAIFCRGDAEDTLYYIRRGTVKLTAVSKAGREAVIGLLRPGDFFGEGCLVGKRKHVATANAMSSTSLLVPKRKEMIRALHEEPMLSHRFILNILNRKARLEVDLVSMLLNPIEKRLARTLLLLARYGKDGRPKKIPKISQKELAKTIGTNRGRVNFFMNKFRKLGHIDYKDGEHNLRCRRDSSDFSGGFDAVHLLTAPRFVIAVSFHKARPRFYPKNQRLPARTVSRFVLVS
jgi:CRP/FNR family transcriptional regulator, cyclic AMP receptor protein